MFPEARGIEVLIIGAMALLIVGPKELPNLLRKLGQFVGKMRSIANDFRASFDEMARQSELDDLRKQVEEMRAQAERAASDHTADVNQAFGEMQSGIDALDAPSAPEPVETAEPAAETAPAKPRRAKAAKAEAKPAEKAKPARRKPAAKSSS